MHNEIRVINVNNSNDFKKITELYNDPNINKTFGGYRTDRLICSEINFLIYLNEKPIGFILLVRKNDKKDYLCIDIALKKEYRSKGYGKIAMEIFRDKFLKLISDDLYIQTKKENIAANKLINILNTEYVESIDDSYFYNILKEKKHK